MTEWIEHYSTVIWWVGSISAFVFLAFLIGVPVIIAKLPSGYFLERSVENDEEGIYSLQRLIFLIFKNVAGALLLLAGIAMLFLPGQGLITVFIGLALMNIPGKHRLMLKIVRQKHIWRFLNRLRAKFNKPAFKAPR